MSTELGFFHSIDIKDILTPKRPSRASLGSLDELASSIERKGLIQPLVVRPVQGGFEVVAGCRRLQVCRRLGWRKIPCHVIEADDKEAYELSLIENIQRRTLNPVEEAEAFQRYVDEYGWGGVSDLAARIGKSHTYVSRRIQLLSLPPNIREAIESGDTNPSAVQEVFSLDDHMREQIGSIVVEEKISSRQVRRLVKRFQTQGGSRSISSPPDLSYASIERHQRGIDKALARSIVALKISLIRLDEVIEEVEDDWVVREILMDYRRILHERIDALIGMRRRLRKVVSFCCKVS